MTLRASVWDRATLQGSAWGFAAGVVLLVAVLLLGFGLYLVALAILIPLLLAIMRRPQLGVLVFAALVPLNGLLLVAPLPSFFAGWKEFAVGAIFVLSLVARPEVRAPPGRKLPGWLPAAVGYLAVGVLSAATVLGSQAAIGLKVDYWDMLLAIAIWRCPLNERERDWLVTIFMVVGFGTAIYGIMQQSIGDVTLTSWGYKYNSTIRFASGNLRSFSTFNQPFPFAFYLMLVILIALPHALSDLRRARNQLFLLSVPVLAVAMFFTYVRAAWIGLGVGLLYFAFHRYKWLLLGIPVVLVALLFIPVGKGTTAAFQSHSLNARTTLWSDKINKVVRQPLGGGIGSVGAAAEKVATDKKLTAPTLQPDNTYLKTAFELGVIGLWMQILLLISLLVQSRRDERLLRRAHRGVDARMVMSFTAQVLAILVASTVATYFEIVPMQSLFWLMAGVVATLGAGPHPAPEPERTVRPTPLSTLAVPS